MVDLPMPPAVNFSIVTPSLNQGRFIRDCIESVRSQTGVTFEHIVIDAGSTDETLAILKEYPHLNWISEPDNGMSDGINKGFRKANGDWMMWLNADDYLLPNALARVENHAKENPTADIIYGECVFVDESKNVLRRKLDHRFDFNILLFVGCYIQSTATFLKRKIISEGHLLDVRYRNCMDFEYYLRLSHLGFHFSYLPETLAAFRWHATNTTTQFSARRYQERVAIQRRYLGLLNRSWLGGTPMLSLLRKLYQTKRFALRMFTHHR
jgi:glycosyltransferase involved in cell wall biosynthesis